jgi:hypothetical protein
VATQQLSAWRYCLIDSIDPGDGIKEAPWNDSLSGDHSGIYAPCRRG